MSAVMELQHPIGIIHGLSNEAYHSGPGISKSHLPVMAKSARAYWATYMAQDRIKKEPTADMVLGTAIHAAVLEPDLFADGYKVGPVVDRRTKAGKAEWEDFLLLSAGCEILTPEMYKTCLNVRDAVYAHPKAKILFREGGQSELSAFAADEETGLLLKCRPDRMSPTGHMIDLKSINDASEDGFTRAMVNFEYALQPPFYADVWKAATGETIPDFIFVAVEKTPPYDIGIYWMSKDDIDFARAKYRRLLLRIAECRQQNEWPGINGNEPKEIKLPPYYFYKGESA